MIRLSALCAGRLYPAGNILGTHFCHRVSTCSDVQGNTDCCCCTPKFAWWNKVHAVWPVDWRARRNKQRTFISGIQGCWLMLYGGRVVSRNVPTNLQHNTTTHDETAWTLTAVKTWKIINGLRRSDFCTFITCLKANKLF